MVHYFYRFLAIALGVVIIAFLINDGLILAFLRFRAHQVSEFGFYLFMPLFWVFLLLHIIYFIIFMKLHRWENEYKVLFVIFVLAAIPRLFLIFLNFEFYQPTSDFLNYFRLGQGMFQGDYEGVARIVASYRVPTMGGLAVYNGLIMRLFSPTIIGFQISNVITTSLICVFIYLIGKAINRKIALTAAMFFSLYLSNIVSTSIMLNIHPMLLYILISMYFMQKVIVTDKKCLIVVYVIFSTMFAGIALVLHISAITFVIAYTVFIIILLFSNANKKTILSFFSFEASTKCQAKASMCKKMLMVMCIFLIGCFMIPQAGVQLMYRRGVINSFESYTVLRNFAVGLDVSSGGSFVNNENLARLNSYPVDERQAVAIQIIAEQLKKPMETIRLIVGKTGRNWFGRDTSFWWYVDYQVNHVPREKMSHEQLESLSRIVRLSGGAERLDQLVVHFLFLLAALGLLLKPYKKPDDIYYLQMIVLIGMFAVIGLGEAQPRYRYIAMPSLMILSSAGLFEIIRIGEVIKARVKPSKGTEENKSTSTSTF